MRIEPPSPEAIREAADAIREGGLAVIPTETVYGLACNALDVDAVRRVYEIKGRPAENPLIVHIAHFSEIGNVAESWPDDCAKLAERFWPGPQAFMPYRILLTRTRWIPSRRLCAFRCSMLWLC